MHGLQGLQAHMQGMHDMQMGGPMHSDVDPAAPHSALLEHSHLLNVPIKDTFSKKNKSSQKLHSCPDCDYQTARKHDLMKHKLVS